MAAYAALDLVLVAFFVKERSEGEKGESRPMKDRLCLGTTPYSRAFKSAAANDGA
jgi:hypothetical protein